MFDKKGKLWQYVEREEEAAVEEKKSEEEGEGKGEEEGMETNSSADATSDEEKKCIKVGVAGCLTGMNELY